MTTLKETQAIYRLKAKDADENSARCISGPAREVLRLVAESYRALAKGLDELSP